MYKIRDEQIYIPRDSEIYNSHNHLVGYIFSNTRLNVSYIYTEKEGTESIEIQDEYLDYTALDAKESTYMFDGTIYIRYSINNKPIAIEMREDRITGIIDLSGNS